MSYVVVKECKTYDNTDITKAINEGIEELGGLEKYIKSGDRVLLKVNLIGPKPIGNPSITHLEFTRSITKILKQKGCEVWIGDSSGGAIAGVAPTAQSFQISGLVDMAKEEGAIIKNFDKEGVEQHGNMHLAKPIFDCDVVINLPKMKTHSGAMYTGAVKNLFGCIPGLKKAHYHKIAPDPQAFGEVIADINEKCNIALHIMDGIEAMQGEGPTAGSVYYANKILISEDPLSLDVIASTMMNMDIDNIPILKKAKERNLGEGNIENIVLKGDFKVIPKLKNFKLSKNYNSTKVQNYTSLVKVIDFFKARPVVNIKKCKNCNMCVDSCPVNIIDKETKKIDYDKCIECLCCHELCLYKAIEIKSVKPFAGIISRISQKFYK